MLQHESVSHFILWLNNIPLYCYITHSLFIHSLMGICVVATFWLSWIKLVWIFMYKFLLCFHWRNRSYDNPMLFPFEEMPNCFLKHMRHSAFLPTMYEASNFSISSSTLIFCVCVCVLYGYPSRCEVVSHCGFNLHFPD